MKLLATLSPILLLLPGANSLAVPRRNKQEGMALAVIPTDQTVHVMTTAVPTGARQILPSLPGRIAPHTTGTVHSAMDMTSRRRSPLMTSPIPKPSSTLLQPVASPTIGKHKPQRTSMASSSRRRPDADIFARPIGTDAPPATIPQRDDHPVPRKGIVKNSSVLQTNKFYSAFFLANQTDPVYTFPYALQWAKGDGPARSWGLAVSHTEPHQRIFGNTRFNGAAEYYLNPVGVQSMILSAAELGPGTVLGMERITAFSARAVLRNNNNNTAVAFPLVQGMPYVTGEFRGGHPVVQSGVYFREMTRVKDNPKPGVAKYNFLLEDGTTWVVYGYSTDGKELDLELTNQGLAQSKTPFTGVVQIAKNPGGEAADAALDDGAGIYPTGVELSGSVSDDSRSGSYTLSFTTAGTKDGSLYMYALPHHIESFDSATAGHLQRNTTLSTTVKGNATLVRGTSWTMNEPDLPTSMGFAPWDADRGGPQTDLSAAARLAIRPVAQLDLSQDMDAQTDIDSMYFSGKALAKFAQVVYLTSDLLGDPGLAQAGLDRVKTAFARFARNEQRYPLVYESAWGGVVSTAAYETGDAMADFGNTYYNDHHFHWGYHILAAAYIGSLDGAWAASNRRYVDTLVRDMANPSAEGDGWFPQWRSFDWYHGHSWAHGLFPAADGKNQESSSEDAMAVYAVKMWGTVVGDADMVARSDLQLAVLRRALRNYYLYEDGKNTVQPAEFVGNKVAGILFENKVHHTTFFSPDAEAIQGIHMMPVLAATGLTRSKQFIREEWDVFFAGGRIDAVDNAWKGVAYAQYALVDARAAWEFFAGEGFKANWVDGGASRSWWMAYAAALGGA